MTESPSLAAAHNCYPLHRLWTSHSNTQDSRQSKLYLLGHI